MQQPIRPNWLLTLVLLAWSIPFSFAQTPFFTEDFDGAALPYALTATTGSSWTNHSKDCGAQLELQKRL